MRMKRYPAFLVSLCIFVLLIACNGKQNYPSNSIQGSWRCYEEGRNVAYNISIDFDRDDSSRIMIYNLYNVGFDVIAYASYADTLISIIYTESFSGHDFSGTGHVQRDFSGIFWNLNYFGSSGTTMVEAWSVRQ